MPAVGSDDLLIRNPSLWAAQGFDVVMPDVAQLIADRQAALTRLVAAARRAADAPIWLVGPGPAVEAAMPELPPGQVSGVVVTSVTTAPEAAAGPSTTPTPAPALNQG